MSQCNFCPMPFLHLNLKQEGKVSACWRYPDRIGDYTENTLTEIWNGEEVKELRRALLNGEQPEGCRSCWDLEASGVTSTRQQTTEDYAEIIDKEKVLAAIDDDYSMPLDFMKSIEIRFDNICNLMCRHCSPDYSSKWEVAVKKDSALMDKMVEYGTYRKKDYHVKLTDEIIEEIGSKISPNLTEILLAGGEPLYHDKHYKFIESLMPNAKNIVLSYNSNLTTLEYKGKNITNLWKRFKRVMLRVSIDGDRDIYHYVRVHNDLDKIENNIKKVIGMKNLRVSATCTTSLLNITRLTSIIEYYLSLGAYFHTSIVQYPLALNPKLLPQELKDKVTADWEAWIEDIDANIAKHINPDIDADLEIHKKRILKFGSSVVKYMNSGNWHDKWDQFVDYTAALDKHLDTDLLDLYPEFAQYIGNTKRNDEHELESSYIT
jgi:radical SAM protein with 4Fe4S-binding SPASM domain